MYLECSCIIKLYCRSLRYCFSTREHFFHTKKMQKARLRNQVTVWILSLLSCDPKLSVCLHITTWFWYLHRFSHIEWEAHISVWTIDKTNNSSGRKWKRIFDHLGWAQQLIRAKGNCQNPQFWHRKSCGNFTQKQLRIEYGIWDSMSASNTICVLFVNCKIEISVIFLFLGISCR